MKLRSMLFSISLVGFHFSASLYGIFMMLGCSSSATFPLPAAWTCALGKLLEWTFLAPVLSLWRWLPELSLSAPVLTIAALFSSVFQVLLLEATLQLVLHARRPHTRGRALFLEPVVTWASRSAINSEI